MFCIKCGKQIDDNSKFCPYCGEITTPESNVLESANLFEKKSHKKTEWKSNLILIIIAVAVCILGAVIFTAIDNKNYEETNIPINDKDTIKETTEMKTVATEQTTVTSKKTTVTTSEKTTTKAPVKTYDITFEADELLDEAGLMLNGHEAVAVLSNLTCSNGTATVETKKIYTYDALVRVKVTGAEAGDITLGGTITTYGLDTYQGETVSYPVNSGVFLIKQTIGNNSGSSSDKTTTVKKAPSVSGNITKQESTYGGYDIYINVSGSYDYYNYKYYEKSIGSSSADLIASGREDKSSFRVSGFSAGVSSVYADITPYNNDGTSGEKITISLDIENSSKPPVKEKAAIYSCNKSGQINCHGGTVAGFTTSYVAEGGSVEKVRSSLGNGWHVTAYNYCTSMGVTWYELYDSDDGDYYGWVDENYIDFGSSSSSNNTVSNNASVYSCSKKGQINCHGGTVAGFTTSYVAEGGSVGKVRSSLGDGWHVTAYNYCTSMGVTWYELYDSDDGDYYGWVDSNYIDFY